MSGCAKSFLLYQIKAASIQLNAARQDGAATKIMYWTNRVNELLDRLSAPLAEQPKEPTHG